MTNHGSKKLRKTPNRVNTSKTHLSMSQSICRQTKKKKKYWKSQVEGDILSVEEITQTRRKLNKILNVEGKHTHTITT